MKKYTVTMVILALLCYFSIAPSATAASDEEEVLQVVSEYFKAWNTNDTKIMTSIHWNSPDMTFFGPNKDTSFLTIGWKKTAEGLKTTFERPVGTYSFSCYDPKVWMIEKNVAIVTMYSIWNITAPSTKEQQIQQIRGTQVFKKMNGKWQIVHVHWSVLPKD